MCSDMQADEANAASTAAKSLGALLVGLAQLPETAQQQCDCEEAVAELSSCLTQLGRSAAAPVAAVTQLRQRALPPAARLAAALLDWWRRPEQQQQDALALAQAAAGRSCAYLRCANLGGEGGPTAGQGVGSMRCRCEGWAGWVGGWVLLGG